MLPWQPGTAIVLEMMGFGVPFMTLPVTVAWDRPDALALWFADGTPYLDRLQPDGTGIPRVITADVFARLETHEVVRVAPGRTVLAVIQPGRSHAIQLHWEMPGWRFRQWYVNLQAPIERDEHGVRTTDHLLDLVVNPDFTWRWKDEDELAEGVDIGRVTPQDAERIRTEGERVLADLAARRPPFTSEYTGWRPDPAWECASIPASRLPEPR